MASSVNKCIFIGHMGKDPDIRKMQTGDDVASLSIACSESWKDKQTGEKIERTNWIPVVIFNQSLIPVIRDYTKKGSKIYVEGAFETRKWQDKKTGQDRYTTEIVLRPFRGEIKLLDSKGSGRPDPNPDDYGTENNYQPQDQKAYDQNGYDQNALQEDSIPF